MDLVDGDLVEELDERLDKMLDESRLTYRSPKGDLSSGVGCRKSLLEI